MRKVGDLLKDMGFNENAPIETQKAFFRHLVAKAALPRTPSQPPKAEEPKTGEQLAFDPKILGLIAK